MKIKRFFATDMRQAIRLVRDEQGPDAVILSSRRVDGGVEIVSAVDFDQDLVSEMVGTPPAREGRESGARAAPAAPAEEDDESAWVAAAQTSARGEALGAKPEIQWSQDPAIVEMRRELKTMRDLMQDQLAQLAWGDLARREPLKAHLIRRLTRLGFSTRIARELAARVSAGADMERAWREVLYLLSQDIRVADDDLLNEGGVVALVGPTGVGKTTTAAKLAARFALRHGRQHVAMISADAFRIGAQKQLLTFGQLIGVEVHAAAGPQEVSRLLDQLVTKRLVIIDTAGMSQRDLRLTEQFKALARVPAIRTYLVASATTQRGVLEEVVRAFSRLRLDACILTKLDEAASLGDALSMVLGHRLPLAYVSDGQRVPEDLHPARVSRLISRAVALADSHEKAESLARGAAGPSIAERGTHAHV